MREFMSIIEQALAEKAHPDRLIMYHGTNGWAAREIAKMGFVPEPEDRTYGDDNELQS